MFNKKYIILYLIILFLLARLYLLFAGLESLIPLFPEHSELYRGTIAKMYMEGSINSLLYYQAGDYNGISTVESLAAIPFFYVFGPYLFSLKLVALAFLLATMVLWFFFIKRYITTEAAVITALLFIFAPPIFISYNLIIGFHSVILFFDILALTFFFEMIRNTPLNPLLIEGKRHISNISPLKRGGMGGYLPYAQGERVSAWWHVLFGVTSGFALWVDNVFAITLITCVVFWFILDRRFFLKRTFAIFVIGFFIGFSIWFYYVIYIRHFQIMSLFEYGATSAKPIIYKKFSHLLAYKLPYSLCFKDYLFSGVFLNYLYYAIFIIAFLGLIWFQRKQLLKMLSSFLPPHLSSPLWGEGKGEGMLSKADKTSLPAEKGQTITVEPFLLGYIVIFILTFSLSPFDPPDTGKDIWPYRFFTPLFPFIFVTIAIWLNKLLNVRQIPFKPVSCAFIFILTSAGIMGLISHTNIRDFGKGLTLKGYSYKLLSDFNNPLFRTDFISKLVKVAKIDDGLYENYLYQCYGLKLAYLDKIEPSACEPLICDVEKTFHPNCYEGFGYGYGLLWGNAFTMLERLKSVNLTNKDYKKYFLYGIATGIGLSGSPIYETVDKHTFLISQIDSQFQPYFYQELGVQLAKRMGLADMDKNLLQIDEANRKYCCIGIGQESAKRLEWAFADKKYYIGFDSLNKDYWSDCYYGLGWGIGDFFEFDMDRYLAIINNNVSQGYMEYCFKGLADRLRWRFGGDVKMLQKVMKPFADWFALNDNTIRFYDKAQRKYLVKGWPSTEEWGTWSEGEESVILVNFTPASPSNGEDIGGGKDYTMLIKATGFSVPGKQQNVKIYLEDTLLGEHTFTHPTGYFEDFEIKIPSAYIKEGNQRIRFVYSFTGSPAEHGMGPDVRQLAMGVISIEFK